MSQPILQPEREAVIRAAFTKWYTEQPKKKDAMELLGRSSTQGPTWTAGFRAIPVDAVIKLWTITQDKAFLWTAKEKEHYQRAYKKRNDLSQVPTKDWPDLDDSSEPVTVENPVPTKQEHAPPRQTTIEMSSRPIIKPADAIDQLRNDIEDMCRRLEEFEKLPSNSNARNKARKRLVLPAMRLFNIMTMLEIKFPEDFNDLRQQLEFASNLIGSVGSKPKERS